MADIHHRPSTSDGRLGSKTAIRCAIYTRKSSEEGLAQEFNSLHAQREACEAYIASQRHEGWIGLATAYDDGGFSGGSMERPALARLLQDIEAGLIDVVVVYKIDRLTRSLFDFARIVGILDGAQASFVSVTQSFNTTTSMGRLTLNVLLSFAQFEREVTGERIRDKIAASRAKGMFMGGAVPLGYDLVDHHLVIHDDEANTVRMIFKAYSKGMAVTDIREALDRRGVRTKPRGRSGGKRFTNSHLYWILSNPTYAGHARHKQTIHPGRHDAIIDEELWQAVQARLTENRRSRTIGRTPDGASASSLLAGLLFTGTGQRYGAVHTAKGKSRHRYYELPRANRTASSDRTASQQRDITANPKRLPAGEFEATVTARIAEALNDPGSLAGHLLDQGVPPGQLEAMIDKAHHLARSLKEQGWQPHKDWLRSMIAKVILHGERIAIHIRPDALASVLANTPTTSDQPALSASAMANTPGGQQRDVPSTHVGNHWIIEAPFTLMQSRRHGRTIIRSTSHESNPEPDPTLVHAILRARRWYAALLEGKARSISALAKTEQTNRAWISAQLPLAFLAPDIAAAIIEGRQAPALTLRQLSAIAAAHSDWADQRKAIAAITNAAA